MRLNRSVLLNIAGCAIAGGALFLFGWAAEKNARRPEPGKPSVAQVRAAYDRLPVPSDDAPESAADSFDRGVTINVSGHFLATGTSEQVFAYYRDRLSKQGWRLDASRVSSEGRPSIKFCKDGLSLVIGAIPQVARAPYYLSVSWTKSKAAFYYCPPT